MLVHPASSMALAPLADPEAEMRLRLPGGRQSGKPQDALDAYAERQLNADPPFAGPVTGARDLVNGVQVATDLGVWEVHETPGHAASHVCLYQPEHRLLISGDHLLGRIVLWFDRGDTPHPVAEYLRSLDVVSRLQARLALSGHGKPFLDVPGHIEGSRRLVLENIDRATAAVGAEPRTAMTIALDMSREQRGTRHPAWLLSQTLCYLRHLEQAGHARRETDGELQFWR